MNIYVDESDTQRKTSLNISRTRLRLSVLFRFRTNSEWVNFLDFVKLLGQGTNQDKSFTYEEQFKRKYSDNEPRIQSDLNPPVLEGSHAPQTNGAPGAAPWGSVLLKTAPHLSIAISIRARH
jgi:hypothetical protein